MSRNRSRRQPRTLLLLLPVVAALSLASCGQTPGGGDGPPDGVEGDWSLTTATDGKGPLRGAAASLTVEGSSFDGTSPCNGYSGTVAVSGDTFRVKEMFVESAACLTASGDDYDRAGMALQDRYVDALGRVTRASAGADLLVLTGDDVELTFSREAPVPDASVEGTRWVLETKYEGESAGAGSVFQGAFLRLDGQGTLTGTGGCRTFTGPYRLQDGALTVTGLTLTGTTTGCSADAAALDDALRAFLSTPATVSVEKDQLRLMQGDTGFGFTAAP